MRQLVQLIQVVLIDLLRSHNVHVTLFMKKQMYKVMVRFLASRFSVQHREDVRKQKYEMFVNHIARILLAISIVVTMCVIQHVKIIENGILFRISIVIVLMIITPQLHVL